MSSVDDEGKLFLLLDEIIDHRKNGDVIESKDSWFVTKTGTRRRKNTSKGWELLISRKDGTSCLVLFILWADDCCLVDNKAAVLQAVKDFTSIWDCEDLGELKEYCKLDQTTEWIWFAQPVKVQRFVDEFGCKGLHTANKPPATPGKPETVLEFNKEQDTPLTGNKQIKH